MRKRVGSALLWGRRRRLCLAACIGQVPPQRRSEFGEIDKSRSISIHRIKELVHPLDAVVSRQLEKWKRPTKLVPRHALIAIDIELLEDVHHALHP